MFPTRSIEQCEKLAAMWVGGEREKVIQEMGEPSPKFLRDFRTTPKKSSPKSGSTSTKPVLS